MTEQDDRRDRAQQFYAAALKVLLVAVAIGGAIGLGTYVVVNALGLDDTTDGTRPAHTILLGNRIPICEHMCGLEKLPDSGFRFHAAPVKVKAFGTFPVRAYAVLGE